VSIALAPVSAWGRLARCREFPLPGIPDFYASIMAGMPRMTATNLSFRRSEMACQARASGATTVAISRKRPRPSRDAHTAATGVRQLQTSDTEPKMKT
jgi:hypothetical protein